jgi:hypothetical protein
MKNRIELKLKFPAKGIRRVFGRFHKRKIGFRFTHFALFQAMEVLDCEPDEIDKFDEKEQLFAIAYGGAVYDCIKTGRKVFFSYKDIKIAFQKGTMEQGEAVGKAWANASYPDWVKKGMGLADNEPAKKKSQNRTS